MAVGIKETSELLVGVNEVALVVVKNFGKGVVGEFEAFYQKLTSDPDFKAKVGAAYDNYQAIPGEIGDLDLSEGVSLVVLQASYVPKIVAALHG